ncbi:RFFL ligase, partial [Amia calva]|nr:RFFL ligase [Amia calva]
MWASCCNWLCLDTGEVEESGSTRRRAYTNSGYSGYPSPPNPELTCRACRGRCDSPSRRHVCVDCKKLYCSSCALQRELIPRCHTCQRFWLTAFERTELMKLKVKDLRDYLHLHEVSTQTCREKEELVELVLGQQTPSKMSLSEGRRVRGCVILTRVTRGWSSAPQSNRVQTLCPSLSLPSCHFQNWQQTQACLQIVLPIQTRSPQCCSHVHKYSQPLLNSLLKHLWHQLQPQVFWSMMLQAWHTYFWAVPPILFCRTSQAPSGWIGSIGAQPFSDLSRDVQSGSNVEDALPSGRRASLSDLSCADDIEALSVRQLKEILARNFVNYKGCCEKWELMERVTRLYNEQKDLQIRVTSPEDGSDPSPGVEENLCKICMDSPIDCVLLECGHMVTCTKCGKRMSECPICRQYVVRAVHVFRS